MHAPHQEDVLSADEHLPLDGDVACHIHHPIDALEERGLPRTCWTDDPEDLVLGHLEIDVVERGLGGVAYGQVLEHDVRGCSRHVYHFLLERSRVRRAMETALTASTSPTRTTAVPYCNESETPATCVASVKR